MEREDVASIIEELYGQDRSEGARDRIAARVERIFVRDRVGVLNHVLKPQWYLLAWSQIFFPAQMMGPLSRLFPNQRKVLNGVFDGLEKALREFVRHGSVSYDSLWPLLELIELLAGEVSRVPALHALFARRYVGMYEIDDDPVLQSALTWLINELVERGEASVSMALRICRGLLEGKGPIPSTVIRLVARARPVLDQEFSAAPAFQSPLPKDVSSLIELSQEARNRIADKIRTKGRGITSGSLIPLLDPLVQRLFDLKRGERVTALAATKEALKFMCKKLGKHKERGGAVIQDVCAHMLEQVNDRPRRQAFLTIEACEAIRDKAPFDCAVAMADFAPRASPRLAIGIWNCIAEAFEEAVDGALPSPPLLRLRWALPARRWILAGRLDPKSVEVFFERVIPALNKDARILGPCAHWINARFDLHSDAERLWSLRRARRKGLSLGGPRR
jgi:hypothetical protein